MLIDDIDNSINQGKKALGEKTSKTLFMDLEKFEKEFAQKMLRLQNYEKSVAAAKTIGTMENDQSQWISNILTGIRGDLEKNDISHAVLGIKNLENAIQPGLSELKTIWSGYRDDKMNATRNIFSALSIAEVIDEDVADKIGELTIRLRERTIPSKKAIEEVEEYAKISSEEINKLDMSDNIKQFMLKLTTENNITLYDAMDTDGEIIKWLQTFNLLDKIKISF